MHHTNFQSNILNLVNVNAGKGELTYSPYHSVTHDIVGDDKTIIHTQNHDT